ncbi:hypothetical protein [Enterococcus sp. DIV0187]|uniref:hypothetical protein n=1 Tax=Enterococcus sp. DIV0187 TaxID=2774644 RepID=UPI003F2616F6
MRMIEKITNVENIELAKAKVKSNKGEPGIDKMTVNEIDDYFQKHEAELSKQLREGKYQPKPVRRVYIPKTDGSKRPLGIPTVVDRVVPSSHETSIKLLE